jgi:hypothetical protein
VAALASLLAAMAACTAQQQPSSTISDATHSYVAGSAPQPYFTWQAALPTELLAACSSSATGRQPQERPAKQARTEQSEPQQNHLQAQQEPQQEQCSGPQLLSALLDALPLGSMQQVAFLACLACAYLRSCAALFTCCCSGSAAAPPAAGGSSWAAGSTAGEVLQDAAFLPAGLLATIRWAHGRLAAELAGQQEQQGQQQGQQRGLQQQGLGAERREAYGRAGCLHATYTTMAAKVSACACAGAWWPPFHALRGATIGCIFRCNWAACTTILPRPSSVAAALTCSLLEGMCWRALPCAGGHVLALWPLGATEPHVPIQHMAGPSSTWQGPAGH